MSVYFITCRQLGMVKIGYARRPPARFSSIRVACPLDTALELILPGMKDEEQALHKRLKGHRVRGEWFWITEEIERLIANPPGPQPSYVVNERVDTEWQERNRVAPVTPDYKAEKRRRLLRELAALDEEPRNHPTCPSCKEETACGHLCSKCRRYLEVSADKVDRMIAGRRGAASLSKPWHRLSDSQKYAALLEEARSLALPVPNDSQEQAA